MKEPTEKTAPKAADLALATEEDWWKGWRLDEPPDGLLADLANGTTDWWSGWHAALHREE